MIEENVCISCSRIGMCVTHQPCDFLNLSFFTKPDGQVSSLPGAYESLLSFVFLSFPSPPPLSSQQVSQYLLPARYLISPGNAARGRVREVLSAGSKWLSRGKWSQGTKLQPWMEQWSSGEPGALPGVTTASTGSPGFSPSTAGLNDHFATIRLSGEQQTYSNTWRRRRKEGLKGKGFSRSPWGRHCPSFCEKLRFEVTGLMGAHPNPWAGEDSHAFSSVIPGHRISLFPKTAVIDPGFRERSAPVSKATRGESVFLV